MNPNNAIALDTSLSVVVQACAGSGKTWLLSSRIARALLEGFAPRSILALTFTNKAAAEMRNRVIGHLREMASMPESELQNKLIDWGFRDESLQQAMRAAPQAFARFLLDPQPPAILTFHSWYAKISAMAPLSLAGAATMSLSTQPWDLMRRAWQRFYETRIQGSAYERLVSLMGSHNLRLACENWVRLQVEWAAFGRHLEFAQSNSAKSLLGYEQAILENEQAVRDFYLQHKANARILSAAFENLPGKEALAAYLKRWDPQELEGLTEVFFTAVSSRESLDTQSRQRFRLKGGNDRFFRKTQELRVWAEEFEALKSATWQLASALFELIDQLQTRLVKARSQMLWSCSQELLDCLGEVMASGHEIDFAGLEAVAWNLLGGESAADFHARLDTQIRHILVDEFQDTNPAQWAMLRSWLEQYVQDDAGLMQTRPKVFLVGDPKQSIYRFRRADPQVFQAASDWLVEHYEAIGISTNETRRCGPQIVDFLNRAMPQIAAQGRYAAHISLAPKNTGFVGRLPLAANWQQEGQAIACALSQIKHDHPQLRWSDMRVLVRRRTHVVFYERALALASIPFVSDRSGGLLTEPEVRDLIALLRFLAFPWSDLDCAHALKSPIFGLDDGHLAQIAQHSTNPQASFYERLKSLSAKPGADPALSEAAKLLKLWAERAANLPVHDLLDRIIHERAIFDRMASRFARARGLQCIANIEAFMALALELDTGRLPSLARFLQELGRWARLKDIDAPGPGLMPNVDAVSVSTMHSAKGLESEVVVLAGLMDRDPADAGIRWLIDWSPPRDAIRGACAWQPSDPLTDTAWNALNDDRRQSNDEDFNLLYVGATRAKRILLFSAAQSKKNVDEDADKIADKSWFGKIKDHCEEFSLGKPSADSIDLNPLEGQPSPRAYVWRGIPFAVGVYRDLKAPEIESLAIRKGKALHRLLEFEPGFSMELANRRLAPFGLSRLACQEVLDAVKLIQSHAWSRVIFNPKALAYAEREWPVGDPSEPGFIRPDRVIQVAAKPEQWWIVDFKWDVLRSEHADYIAQLSGYLAQFRALWPDADISARILTAKGEAWTLTDGRLILEKV